MSHQYEKKKKIENVPFYLGLILQVKIHNTASQTREI